MNSFEVHSMETPAEPTDRAWAQQSPRQRGVEDLPDLTGHLIRHGLHEEYVQYRARYLAWRQGGTAGAVGELTMLGAARRQGPEPAQEMWHPTAQKFDFFYTVSYWTAVVGLVGAMILCVVDISQVVVSDELLAKRKDLLAMITSMGDFFYTLSCYLAYFELINFPEDGHYLYFFPTWGTFWERVSVESALGSVAYFSGMIVWDVNSVCRILDYSSDGVSGFLLRRLPVALGGIAFAIGGACEVVHNRGKSCKDVVWWVSLLDAFGGALFALGSILGIFDLADYFCSLCFAVGMLTYLSSCILLLVMWRGNDFGLTLLRQLNASLGAGARITISATAQGLRISRTAAVTPQPASAKAASFADAALAAAGASTPRSGATPRTGPVSTPSSGDARQLEEASASREPSAGPGGRSGEQQATPRRLSMRGVVFLVLYCWLFACGAMNCLAGMFTATGAAEHLLTLAGGLLWLLMVAIVLIVHSSVTSVPNQQPYRFAMLAMRCTLFLASVLHTLLFVRWWHHLHHPEGIFDRGLWSAASAVTEMSLRE